MCGDCIYTCFQKSYAQLVTWQISSVQYHPGLFDQNLFVNLEKKQKGYKLYIYSKPWAGRSENWVNLLVPEKAVSLFPVTFLTIVTVNFKSIKSTFQNCINATKK